MNFRLQINLFPGGILTMSQLSQFLKEGRLRRFFVKQDVLVIKCLQEQVLYLFTIPA